jgi:transcriptional regulator of acetoin/glycerol metabolism
MTDTVIDTVRPLDDVIREHVLGALTTCGGDKMRTAKALKIARSTLYRMLEEWGAK